VTKVVIVSRTRMHNGVCIGGLMRDSYANVRLLPSEGVHAHSDDAPYRVGDVWGLDLEQPAAVRPPHVEDMIVRRGRRLGVQTGLDFWLREHVEPWEGDASTLFDGVLQQTASGTAYVGHLALPASSVGFWLPGRPLPLDETCPRYRTTLEGTRISVAYVGCEPPAAEIPAWTLVRVSLARWFSPGDDAFEGCWLQISGWYERSKTSGPSARVSGLLRDQPRLPGLGESPSARP
jgi:hypothetical protein